MEDLKKQNWRNLAMFNRKKKLIEFLQKEIRVLKNNLKELKNNESSLKSTINILKLENEDLKKIKKAFEKTIDEQSSKIYELEARFKPQITMCDEELVTTKKTPKKTSKIEKKA